ncbi:hypothetical protein HYQ46_003132 [Verticillium longisporum]|nr:hypothetical protein HYQ46_003132 [Verticillium longisporum]
MNGGPILAVQLRVRVRALLEQHLDDQDMAAPACQVQRGVEIALVVIWISPAFQQKLHNICQTLPCGDGQRRIFGVIIPGAFKDSFNLSPVIQQQLNEFQFARFNGNRERRGKFSIGSVGVGIGPFGQKQGHNLGHDFDRLEPAPVCGALQSCRAVLILRLDFGALLNEKPDNLRVAD